VLFKWRILSSLNVLIILCFGIFYWFFLLSVRSNISLILGWCILDLILFDIRLMYSFISPGLYFPYLMWKIYLGAVWIQGSGSKELGKCYFSLPYLSKHRKRKMRKPFYTNISSFPFYTNISSLLGCYS